MKRFLSNHFAKIWLLTFLGLAAGLYLFWPSGEAPAERLQLASAGHVGGAESPKPHAKPIANIQLGERVIGRNPELADADRNWIEPDPATWEIYAFELRDADGSFHEIELLRPIGFLEFLDRNESGQYHLELSEMGAEGWSTLTATKPCPPGLHRSRQPDDRRERSDRQRSNTASGGNFATPGWQRGA